MTPIRVRETRLTVEDLSLVQARLLWCYEGGVDRAHRHARSDHPTLSAWWLQRGEGSLRRGGSVWRAGVGEWLFGGPHPRRQDFSPDARILSIRFSVAWPSGESLVEQPLVVRATDFPQLGRTARPLLRFVTRHFPGAGVDLWKSPADLIPFFGLQHLFSHWIAAYLGVLLASGVVPAHTAGADPRVLKALRIVQRHPWSKPFREKDLAQEIGLSVGHLDRLFVQQIGMTPRACLQKRRLESALGLLIDPAMPIKEIGYDLGFSSPGHFCHWFKQVHGTTPSRFRASHHP